MINVNTSDSIGAAWLICYANIALVSPLWLTSDLLSDALGW